MDASGCGLKRKLGGKKIEKNRGKKRRKNVANAFQYLTQCKKRNGGNEL